MLKHQHQLHEALAEYESSLEIAQRLVDLDPFNPSWEEDLRQVQALVDGIRESVADSQ